MDWPWYVRERTESRMTCRFSAEKPGIGEAREAVLVRRVEELFGL